MASLLAGPIGLVLMGATCALVVSVLRSNWFFNESEKAMIPAALQSIAKEAILGILFIVLFSILGIALAFLISGGIGLITKILRIHR